MHTAVPDAALLRRALLADPYDATLRRALADAMREASEYEELCRRVAELPYALVDLDCCGRVVGITYCSTQYKEIASEVANV